MGVKKADDTGKLRLCAVSDVLSIADELTERFIDQGFVVQRYDSKYSVYIKLDFGLGYSIRVSNHKSRKRTARYEYRYNIGPHIDHMYSTEYLRMDGRLVERLYYPPGELDVLVDDAVQAKSERLFKYGDSAYKRYMDENKKKIDPSKLGFWGRSVLMRKVSDDE